MRDTDEKNIDHPAAMVFDNLGAQIEDKNAPYHENDESVADAMESMRRFNPQRLMRERERAKEMTSPKMKNRGRLSPGYKPGIKSMPRPE